MVELTANLLGEIKCTKAAFASGKPKWPLSDQEGVKEAVSFGLPKCALLPFLNSPQMHPTHPPHFLPLYRAPLGASHHHIPTCFELWLFQGFLPSAAIQLFGAILCFFSNTDQGCDRRQTDGKVFSVNE